MSICQLHWALLSPRIILYLSHAWLCTCIEEAFTFMHCGNGLSFLLLIWTACYLYLQGKHHWIVHQLLYNIRCGRRWKKVDSQGSTKMLEIKRNLHIFKLRAGASCLFPLGNCFHYGLYWSVLQLTFICTDWGSLNLWVLKVQFVSSQEKEISYYLYLFECVNCVHKNYTQITWFPNRE